MSTLIEMTDVTREFPAGEGVVAVLKNINLTINAGEMIAIVGQSGSGKSTLMNILGCLDRPTRGRYHINGAATTDLLPDELAQLRREYFGFIFQRYHLLGDLSALANVEIPAIYAGKPPEVRHHRANELLTRLGLAHRLVNCPSQLSGGQQQRVSIARALMNGGHVILADEPTGALDRQSGSEVMQILRELHSEGHTIILVTHDMGVAQNAHRIIELSDGEIIDDRVNEPSHFQESSKSSASPHINVVPTQRTIEHRSPSQPSRRMAARAAFDRFSAAFRMALIAMSTHRLRTFLTMLGIIIGIASVVSVIALGTGSREKVLSDISSLGTNTVTVYSGTGFGNPRNDKMRRLMPDDAAAIASQPYVDSISPTVRSSGSLRYRNISADAVTLNGVGGDFLRVQGFTLSSGLGFDNESVKQLRQDVLIDENTVKQFFPDGANPIGQVIMVGTLPCRIIGTVSTAQNAFSTNDALNVYLPYTTVMQRIVGQNNLRNIVVRIKETLPSAAAEESIVQLLTQRHGTKDVFTQNSDTIRQTVEKTTATLTLMVSAIALISLIVGGIGVMNIMLVSVTERTQEIGVRMAVGARQSDVMQQFLIESVLVCIIGGILGIALALLIGQLFTHFAGDSFSMKFSLLSMVIAFGCSSLIGIIFGFLPARSAARLDPISALARE